MSGSESPEHEREAMRKARGDLFWEAVALSRYTPIPLDAGLGPYVHQYAGYAREDQVLSTQMRELIATVLLVWRGDHRFAANHVRRLYRLGVTDEVIVEAFWAASLGLGRSIVLHAVSAIHAARDERNHEGELPPGGPPASLADFPELHLHAPSAEAGRVSRSAEWQFVATLDPWLADLVDGFTGRVFGDAGSWHLPAGARHLIACVAMSARGAEDAAARHIIAALGLGATTRHIVDALSAAIPMTGLPTVECGVRAIIRAQSSA